MAANNKNQKAVDRLLYPVEGGRIGVRDFLTDEGGRSYVDFADNDYITKKALDGFNPSAQVLDITLDTTKPDLYTLSAPELAIINTYTRYPNFVAILTGSGQQWFDIYPFYIGVVGAFTQVKVQLHSDGAGRNVDTTLVQFS